MGPADGIDPAAVLEAEAALREADRRVNTAASGDLMRLVPLASGTLRAARWFALRRRVRALPLVGDAAAGAARLARNTGGRT